jgi:peptidyl-prolyl cis-trans isomerase C
VKFPSAFTALLAASSLFAQAPAPPAPSATPLADPNKVVLTIGNETLTAAQYEDLVASLPAQYQTAARGPGKRQFAEQIVQLKILSAEAAKNRLDQKDDIKRQIDFAKANILAGAFYQSLQDSTNVDDEAVQKYYDAHKADYDVVKARHILIRVKGAPMPAPPGKPELTDEQALAKAQAIRKRIVGGEDFAKVAQAESDDTGSGSQGGNLGEFKRGMMVPPFEEAAFAAKVNDISEPVKTPFGYHIIKVESHESKTLADQKTEIIAKMRPDLARTAIDNLRKGTKVEMDEAFFGPAAPAAGGPPVVK